MKDRGRSYALSNQFEPKICQMAFIMNKENGYQEVAGYFPQSLKRALQAVPGGKQGEIVEIRVRVGRPISLYNSGGSVFLHLDGRADKNPMGAVTISEEEMRQLYFAICGNSVHSFADQVKNGFITLPGGHRVGVAGTAQVEQNRILSVAPVSSLNFRIASMLPRAADSLLPQLYPEGLRSVLIAGAPLSGKTTLLKSILYRLSSGYDGRFTKIAAVDERGELGGVYDGVPQNDLGPCTDILTGYPKGIGMEIAVRTLSPELLVCDEIGGEGEAAAIQSGINAGVRLLATVHADGLHELCRKKWVVSLLREAAFDCVLLLGKKPGQVEDVLETGEVLRRMEVGI